MLFLAYKFQLSSLELCVLTIIIVMFLSIANNFITSKLECQKSLNQLQSIKDEMIELVNPNRMYERMGVDKLCIQFNEKLLPIADPDLEGQLLPKTVAVRQRITDKLGYIIPNVRIIDSNENIDYEYKLFVNDIFVDNGFVYPNRVMVLKTEWNNNIVLPQDTIKSINPIDKKEVYWVNETTINEIQCISSTSPVDVIINHLQKIAIKYSNEIMSHSDIKKLIKLLELTNPGLTENLMPTFLTTADLKKILTNLITEEISIKDVLSVFENLNDFARFSKNPDELSEKLRYAFRRQIQQKYAYDYKVYAITFSQDTEKQLETLINHSSDGERTDFKPIANVIIEALNNLEEKIIPVVLVSSKIRLQLYRSLSELIPSINVISYSELSQNTHIEVIKEISNEHNKIYN